MTEFRMAGPMLAFLQLIAAVDAGPYWFRQVIGDYNKHGGLSPMTEDDVVDWAARAELLLQEMQALK